MNKRELIGRIGCIVWLSFLTFGMQAQHEMDSIFTELEKVLALKGTYDFEKETRLKGLKALLFEHDEPVSQPETYRIHNKLIEEYWAYSFDSTVNYIHRNLNIAHKAGNYEWVNKCQLDLAMLLASSGRYKESQDILEGLNKAFFTEELRRAYFNCYRKIYSDLNYFGLENEKQHYWESYNSYTDSVTPLIREKEDEYLYAQEWEMLDQERFEESLMINSLRLKDARIATEKYSYINFQRSMIYEYMGDRRMEQKYLAISAISDIMASRKDNASLAKLALRTYENGDMDRAYLFITHSFEDAIFYNSKLRVVEIANSFSLIMEAHELASQKKNRALLIFTIVVSLLSLILFVLLYFVYLQKNNLQVSQKQLHEINQQHKALNISLQDTMSELKQSYQDLAEANHIKELYIGNFMTICSDFIDKLDKYRLNVNKMLRLKKYEKLFDMTKTMETIEEEVELFYATFDETFLSLYPSFVNDLNHLLLEEERIVLRNDEILNPELRIFALIRLGIKDSARIAHLLRYSVNTIYNYRVKIKNKASGNREEFEDQIMQIGAYKKIG